MGGMIPMAFQGASGSNPFQGLPMMDQMTPMFRPFDPTQDQPIQNPDGSQSTERTRTVQTPEGWANVPSLWFNGHGYMDMEEYSDDELSEFAQGYEQDTGVKFPRFRSVEEAVAAAKARSAKGGALSK